MSDTKHPKTEGILRDFMSESENPYRFMTNDVPPAHQLDRARSALITETAAKLQSDGYHTFDELYHYRALYNAAFFNSERNFGQHKSLRHADGKYCFDAEGEWFIIIMNLPTGQISNHYHKDYWDMFNIPEKFRADKWDGHTPQQAADRLEAYLRSTGASTGVEK